MMKHLAKMIVKKILIAATAAPLQIQPRVNPQKSLPLRKEMSARGSVNSATGWIICQKHGS